MNPAQLLAHFDRICDAPDAVPRLRRFILDLAVRGKLVEQDPNDEPAATNRTSIANTTRGRGTQEAPNDEIFPYDLPSSWTWHRLENLSEQITDGEHATPQRINEQQVPLVSVMRIARGKRDGSGS
jgi:type I restriction enzyme, S subunit